MQISEPPVKRELENLLPLVNVVFLLLIFFMVAGAFSSPELFTITPIQAENNSQADNQILTIIINEKGELAINEQQIPEDSLQNIINDYLLKNPNYQIQIKPDANVEALRIVELLERLSATNLEVVHIMTSAAQ